MTEPLKVALMGCGRISKRHAAVLHDQAPGATLAAVCDIISARAESTGKQYDVPYFTSVARMIAAIQPDILAILTPSGNHSHHINLVAGTVPHIIVEKPLALTTTDIIDAHDACEQSGTTLTVVHQNRYNLPVLRLRQAIDENRLGNITLATIRVRWSRAQDYYTDWHGTWKYAGGVLANQAIHHVDLLRLFCGPVDTVYAYAVTASVQAEVEDTLVAVLKFKSGALGTIEATTATRPVDLEGSLSILGDKGTVEIGGFAVNKMLHWEFIDKRPDDFEIACLCENPPNIYGFGHKAFYQDYIRHIQSNQLPPISWQDGYNVVEVIEAIYESVETGAEVKVGSPTSHIRLGKSIGNE